MNALQQIVAVTMMNLRSLPQRLGTSFVIIIGIGGVVAVLVSVLAMSTGMIKTMQNSGRNDRVIVLRNGSASEVGSVLLRDAALTIMDSPGIKRGSDGKPIASAEVLRLLNVQKNTDGSEVNVAIRGISPQASAVRPEMKLIEGRMFQPAVNEMIVGKAAKAQYKNMEIGSQIKTRTAVWTVVGTFTSNGDSHESELMTDANTLMSVTGRGSYSSITAVLDSPNSFNAFADALTTNPALSVDATRESDYYAQQSETITKVLSVIAYVVGGIMAVGAVFGALNTMYSAVSARAVEIATLRAIGFGPMAMVTSVLVESLLLATAGGFIGALVAWLFFNGNTVSTTAGIRGAPSQLIFDIAVSPQLVIIGVVWAGTIGLIGGLFPAIRAARLPVATALRAT